MGEMVDDDATVVVVADDDDVTIWVTKNMGNLV